MKTTWGIKKEDYLEVETYAILCSLLSTVVSARALATTQHRDLDPFFGRLQCYKVPPLDRAQDFDSRPSS